MLNKFLIYTLLITYTISATVIFTGSAIAQTAEENYLSIKGGWQYYAKDDTICINSSGTGVLEGENTPGDVYSSGLQGPYILEQYMIHVLKRLAQKYNKPETDFVTKEHVIALVAFAIGEGGDIMNRSIFNPLNLGYRDDDVAPVAYAANGIDGRQSYPSFDLGVEANARQMSKGTQSRLGTVLSSPNSTAEQFMHALTYYNEYKDNNFWAEASLADPADYYNERINLINTVKKNYATTAALVIGTDKYEQRERLYNTNLIQFTDLLNGESNVSISPGTIAPSTACVNNSFLSDTSGSNVAAIANREYEENKGILEYGGDILQYTDGNREAWCADFVSWVYKEAGLPFTGGASGGWRRASVSDLKQYLINSHTYFNVGDQLPQPGDIAIYQGAGTADSGSIGHTNIVYSVDPVNKTMVTIGGNESNQVRKTSQKIQQGVEALVGFGRVTDETTL